MADSLKVHPSGHYHVFVGNVDYQITPERLEKEMSTAGRVLSCDIPRDASGRPRGYAVVEFETASAARTAIDTLGGLELNGRKITIREDRGKREKHPGSINLVPSDNQPRAEIPRTSRRPIRNNRGRREYGDVRFRGHDQGVSSGSASSGTHRRVPRVRDGDSKKSPGPVALPPRYGGRKALKSSTSSSSSRLTDTSKNFESKENAGRKRQLQRPRIKLDENLQGRLVYYGNLSWSADGANVSEFVGGLSCIIPTDHRGRSKGYALVEYPTDTEALDAVSKFSEVEFLGRRLIARLFVFKSSSASSDGAGSNNLHNGDSATSSGGGSR